MMNIKQVESPTKIKKRFTYLSVKEVDDNDPDYVSMDLMDFYKHMENNSKKLYSKMIKMIRPLF